MPDLRAVGVLAAHVGVRTGVVADEDRAQSGRAAGGGQLRHPLPQVGEDLVARGFAVQGDRSHGSHCGRLGFMDTAMSPSGEEQHSAQCVHRCVWRGQARPGDPAQPHHQGRDVRGIDAERAGHRRPDHLSPAARRRRGRDDDGRLPGGDTRGSHRGQADLVATRGDPRTAQADRRHPRRGRRDQRPDRPRRARRQCQLQQGQGARARALLQPDEHAVRQEGHPRRHRRRRRRRMPTRLGSPSKPGSTRSRSTLATTTSQARSSAR